MILESNAFGVGETIGSSGSSTGPVVVLSVVNVEIVVLSLQLACKALACIVVAIHDPLPVLGRDDRSFGLDLDVAMSVSFALEDCS